MRTEHCRKDFVKKHLSELDRDSPDECRGEAKKCYTKKDGSKKKKAKVTLFNTPIVEV